MWKSVYVALLLSFCLFSHHNSFAEPDTNQVKVYINLWTNTLSFIKNGEIVKSYPIAPGTSETPTPVGDFHVIYKGSNWGTGFGSRWLGLDVPFGHYGIHGTNKPYLIGRRVSHGCVRMRNADIEELYSLVDINTPVRIDGPLLGKEGLDYRILVRGSRGSLVQIVQNRLRAGGYYEGSCNGIFDHKTENAIKQFQRDRKLTVTKQIHFVDLVELGLVE